MYIYRQFLPRFSACFDLFLKRERDDEGPFSRLIPHETYFR
ncbi:unnamed protein product [Phyllotreta striolata]|uniref:Uncharacterized protein n=1 Tax=Phyllotreta striolata TaxID=444603 RepID=A0A9N9TBR0_PHYSR|nr:unnamed protein product [Phyllotreta striolata]